ncbi:pentapeptide repeat-containing protein [Pseudomonas sp. NPDC087804]|uniref:anti-phage Hailong system effector protein HalA n=1 Tax=Pseudomonas sp. NPDC087804 TaxID=3364449 RepID=UPI00383013A6
MTQVKKTKRGTSYWDSVYSGEDLLLKEHDWDLANNRGPSELLFTSENLQIHIKKSALPRFNCKTTNFSDCDFIGDYISNVTHGELSFRKCTFTGCDFGDSIWRGVKFSECSFERCSFTLTEFQDCIFYECQWDSITISGTETKIPNTLVSNPNKFIDSAYTNLNEAILLKNNTTPDYQKMRLEGTKAKFARVLLKNAESHGDDDAYYSAIKTYLNQSLKSKISKSTYNYLHNNGKIRNALAFLAAWFELFLLNISGFINCWGKSIARPAIIGMCLTLIFGILYSYLLKDLATGLVKGFDITFLVGYTKYADKDDPVKFQLLYGLNAFFGLWWYAILVPTLINRISRVN